VTNKERVLSFVQDNPGCTQKEISNELRINSAQANQKLHELMKEGLVKRDEQKRPYKYYSSTDAKADNISQPPQGSAEDMLKNSTKENLLIVVSCSERKVWGKENWGPTYVPAIHAYTGKDVTWLKNNVPKGKDFHCVILSAKYGFIEPEHPICYYDVTFSDPEKGPISLDSIRNQVCYQSRHFGGHEKKLCDFRYVLVKGSTQYVNNTRIAFDSIGYVQEWNDAIWNKVIAKLDP